jgi:hypothetical protein
LNSPILLLEKVTCRFVGFSIFFSSTFPRPILSNLPEEHVLRIITIMLQIPKFIHDKNQIKVSYSWEEIKANGLKPPRSWEIITNGFNLSDAG